MKKRIFLLAALAGLAVNLVACSTPVQPLKVHHMPGQPQKPNGCIMQMGQCKPPNT